MLGKGLLKGMSITFKHFFGKKVTMQYPEEKATMTPLFRGGEIELDINKCIACSLCALACPNHVIELTTVTNEQKKRQLASYVYHSGLCMYCNLCIEACPTKAISWDKDYENSQYDRALLDVDCMAKAQKREVSVKLSEGENLGD